MAKQKEINVPTSMLKKMLGQNGMHVKPESVKDFKKMFLEWAADISKNATANATASKRKTIFKEDLTTVKEDAKMEEDNDEDDSSEEDDDAEDED